MPFWFKLKYSLFTFSILAHKKWIKTLCSWISQKASFLHLLRFHQSLMGVHRDSSICRNNWGKYKQRQEIRQIPQRYVLVAEEMAINLKRTRVLVLLIGQLFATLKTQGNLERGSWLLLVVCTRSENPMILCGKSKNSEFRGRYESLKMAE